MDLTGHIRTYVPIIVGWGIAQLVALDLIDSAVEISDVEPAITGLIVMLYYGLVRLAEKRWPRAGWLLGSPGTPSYG